MPFDVADGGGELLESYMSPYARIYSGLASGMPHAPCIHARRWIDHAHDYCYKLLHG